MAAQTEVPVGTDVAKAQLDIAVEPTDATWAAPRLLGGLRRSRSNSRRGGPPAACSKPAAWSGFHGSVGGQLPTWIDAANTW